MTETVNTEIEITFPIKERRDRLVLGGILYSLLGAALLVGGLYFGQGIFSFAGLILAAVGVGVTGFKRETDIDRKNIRLRRGWFVFQVTTELTSQQVSAILIQKHVTSGSRFSKFDDRQYESTIHVSYKVLLATNSGCRYLIDSTANHADARQWAGTIAAMLNTQVSETDQADATVGNWSDRLSYGIRIIIGLFLAMGVLTIAINVLL